MENLSFDELLLVLMKVSDSNDRKSCSEVCNKWFIGEGLTRSSLIVKQNDPELLTRLILRFQNMIYFKTTKLISDSHLYLLSRTNSALTVLNLRATDHAYAHCFTDNGLVALANACHELIVVVLSGRKSVGDAGVIALVKSNPNLNILELADCSGISDYTLQAIAQAQTPLEVLDLGNCVEITDSGLVALAEANVLQTLNKLVLKRCKGITDTATFLQFLNLGGCLEELNLSSCNVTDIGGVTVATIKRLKRLDLSYCAEISDVTLQAIADAQTPLEVLNLGNSMEITDLGLAALAEANVLQTINSLVLNPCRRITDKGLKSIANAATSLQLLNLGGCNGITDLGLAALATGVVSKTLNKLLISECDQITDHAISFLHQMPCLKELDLSRSKITDIGGVALAAIKRLKRLDLRFCNITDETLIAVSRNCPHLKSIRLTGCSLITGVGIRSFAHHTLLQTIELLFSDGQVTGEDLEDTVVRSQSLNYLLLGKDRFGSLMTNTMIENIRKSCSISWACSTGFEFQEKL